MHRSNVNLEQKVTFRRIQEHLEDTYKQKFSFGSVVQLRAAGNKQRSSVKRFSKNIFKPSKGPYKVCMQGV